MQVIVLFVLHPSQVSDEFLCALQTSEKLWFWHFLGVKKWNIGFNKVNVLKMKKNIEKRSIQVLEQIYFLSPMSCIFFPTLIRGRIFFTIFWSQIIIFTPIFFPRKFTITGNVPKAVYEICLLKSFFKNPVFF